MSIKSITHKKVENRQHKVKSLKKNKKSVCSEVLWSPGNFLNLLVIFQEQLTKQRQITDQENQSRTHLLKPHAPVFQLLQ